MPPMPGQPNVAAVRAPARSEGVGSLLRPPPLKAMFDRIYSPHSSHVAALLTEPEQAALSELNAIAEQAIRDAVSRQIALGLDVVTDGELRRAHYVNSLFDGLSGLAESEVPEFFAGDEDVAPPPEPIARERLRVVSNPLAQEVAFLRSITDHPCKVAIQTPSSLFFPAARYDAATYPTRDAFVDEIVAVVKELVAGAVAAGARYIQFDYPLFPAMADPDKRDELLAGSDADFDAILSKALAADNAVLDDIPADVTTALHVCRGNYRSHWWARGSLEPVAERMFNELRHQRFLVEWEDTGREGDYSPLRFVPPGPIVVMGLVSSKVGALESEDEVVARLEEAAGFLDIDQLALSPQCGFASVWHGNDITEKDQWRKLELVARVADRVWGRA
jgi:5-methyltetrahydropteroyltriglutamate--homocysteine methyltransferase